MALHFVSTSILSSSDGIDFNNEKHQETEEQRAIRLKAEAASSKPLYMQLAEREEEKKAEYDAMTKKIFAPPKALDEEDLAFFSNLQETKDKNQKFRDEEEKKSLAEFRAKTRESVLSAEQQAPPTSIINARNAKPIVVEPLFSVKLKSKRKRIETENGTSKKDIAKIDGNESHNDQMSLQEINKDHLQDQAEYITKKNVELSHTSSTVQHGTATGTGAGAGAGGGIASLLGSYGGDSDDSE